MSATPPISLIRRSLVVWLLACAPGFAQNDPAALTVPLGAGATLELVEITPGAFQQGSPPAEAGRGADEAQREVTLTRRYFLGKFPVTRGQYARFAQESGYRSEAEKGTSGGYGFDGTALVQRKEFTWRNPGFPQTDEHPVTMLTHGDAKAFLAWLSRKSGRAFSLPTEAQWEYACRAGTTTPWPNGSDTTAADEIAWHRQNSGDGTRPVGEKALNAWGLGDMLGNVWEWCEDWYAPYAVGPATDPLQTNNGLSDKPRRVLRGGSWMKDPLSCRSATRFRNDPGSRNADNGFRVMTYDVAAKPAAAPPPPPTSAVPRRPEVALEHDGTRGTVHDVITPDPHFVTHQSGTVTQRRNSPFPILMTVAFIALGVFVLVKIVRAFSRVIGGGGIGVSGPVLRGSQATTGAGASPLRSRVVEDGFWIEGSTIPVGAKVTCKYTANGQPQQTEVVWDGGSNGQFVFTGSRPSNVSIVLHPGSSGMGRTFRNMGTSVPSSFDRDDDDDRRRFRGHPSAY